MKRDRNDFRRICGAIAINAMLLFLGAAVAQAQEADLALEVLMEPSHGVTPPGSSGMLTFTVTNLGPDPSGGLANRIRIESGTERALDVDGFDPPVTIEPAGGSSCEVSRFLGEPVPPEPNVLVSYHVSFPGPLDPGESMVCDVTFSVSPNLRQDIGMLWGTFGGTFDPDSFNDLVFTPFRLPVTAIPTLSQYSLVVFAMALMAAAFFLRRRQRTS